MKTISVIIPTFNRASYLKHLLGQLVSQTTPPDEIIVVDDHSTDSTHHVVSSYTATYPYIHYLKNQGQYQRDAKHTGLQVARGQYIGFLDDDVRIDDSHFFRTLRRHLAPNKVVQAKVILEQMGQKNEHDAAWRDRLTTRPYPVLELLTARLNGGNKSRRIFPIIEFGNFWPANLKKFFIDKNLILDAYGESYASAIKLYRRHVPIILMPELVIRHPGAETGGSQRFDKHRMLAGFTQFHSGYFTNMIYLHTRYFPLWIWLWLPFYLAKACTALAVTGDVRGFFRHAIQPILKGLTISFRRAHV